MSGWNSSGYGLKKKRRNYHSLSEYYVSNSSDLCRLSHLLLTTIQRVSIVVLILGMMKETDVQRM